MKSVIITIIIAIIVFELVEHAVLPLFWLIKNKNKKSTIGASGMIGNIVEVKKWNGTEGRVVFNGELWRAVCDEPLPVGAKGVIVGISGLTLTIKPPSPS